MSRAAALVLACTTLAATTAADAAPVLRAGVTQHGDFALIGNTFGYECAAGTPAPVVGVVPGSACTQQGTSVNDSSPDLLWRSETSLATADASITPAQTRSTAILSLPAGATVTHAYLYWAAVTATADQQVTLDRPNGFSATVTALAGWTGANSSYQSVADVTSIVAAQGAGAYRVGDIGVISPVSANNNNLFAGWWMVVLYELPTSPQQHLAIYDGFDSVGPGLDAAVDVTGFVLPNGGYTGKLGIAAWEGDSTITGDQLFVNGTAIVDGQNPNLNFFNSTRSTFGAATSVAGDLPQLTGTAQSMAGVDLDIVDISARLVPGQTAVSVRASTSSDVFILGGVVAAISDANPDFSKSTKQVTDVNGGDVLPGDTLQYTIIVTNNGGDRSTATVIDDVLPTGVTYVPGSLSVTSGTGAGPKTDAIGDDTAQYDPTTRTVRFDVGTNATATTGGSLLVGQSVTVAFSVTVDAATRGTVANQATITAANAVGSSPRTTMTDGVATMAGQQPTTVFVVACSSDVNCSAPTPYCDTSSAAHACVECLSDANCPGLTPTCGAAHACTCVASGAELCDGQDNDCNGMIDDGQPGAGVDCTTTLSGACAAGKTACTNGATVCDPIVQPGTVAESCDGIDNDCNGSIDDNIAPEACTTGLSGACATGTSGCDNGAPTMCVPTVTPGSQSKACGDAIDNDCDGVVDNGCTMMPDAGVPDGEMPDAEMPDAGAPAASGGGGGCCDTGGSGASSLVLSVFAGLALVRRRRR